MARRKPNRRRISYAHQLWLFWTAPLLGAALAGFVYKWLGGNK